MIRIKLKKDNGKSIKCKIPETWHEVTTKQFIDLGYGTLPESLAVLEVLSVLTQIPLQGLTIIEGDLKPILAVSKLLSKVPDLTEIKKENVIQFMGKRFTIPEIEKMKMHQLAIYSQVANERYGTAKALAIVLQPLIDNNYNLDEKRLEEVTEDILNYPFMPLYPGINFFFRKRVNSLAYGLTNLN